jgi:hypothetical protein
MGATAAASGLGKHCVSTNPPQDLAEKQQGDRTRRLRLQRVAARVMAPLRHLNRKGESVQYRVTNCMWAVTGQGMPGVRLTTQGATYSGLQICASVWHCPCCASRITNGRQVEVTEAVERAKALGKKPVLLTYTARHSAKTQVADQLDAMTDAYEAVWRGEPAKRLKRSVGWLGTVRALESTWSEVNGHHPHAHALMLVDQDADVEAFGEKVKQRWMAMANRRGLTMNEAGFKLTDNSAEIAAYIAKGHERHWTEADEITRLHTKKGRRTDGGDLEQPTRTPEQHCTPWQLLEYAAEGDEKAAKAFREYAEAFHGRQQLSWSKGLKAALGMDEQERTDEELAAEESQEAKVLLEVALEQQDWKTVRGNDARAELLTMVERSGGDVGVLLAEVFAAFGFWLRVISQGGGIGGDLAEDEAR